MNFVIFGLSVSSSWGNGHAALWRALIRALLRSKHRVVFFERNVSYYADHRDLFDLPTGGTLVFYNNWTDVSSRVRDELLAADVAIVTSYCPDSQAATQSICETPGVIRCFYDLDTPVTLARFDAGESVEYIGSGGLAEFDLTFSFTGGQALKELQTKFGARTTCALYGSVDPDLHYPERPRQEYEATLSYVGTYAADRSETLNRLLIDPALTMPDCRFIIAGAQYPDAFPSQQNILLIRHLPPPEHSVFYSSSKMTLNITRAPMARMGWCPSGRLFEAAACRVPILTDWFDGLDEFFEPDHEIIVAHTTSDALSALQSDSRVLDRIAARARERVLDQHTAGHRAIEMVSAIEDVSNGLR